MGEAPADEGEADEGGRVGEGEGEEDVHEDFVGEGGEGARGRGHALDGGRGGGDGEVGEGGDEVCDGLGGRGGIGGGGGGRGGLAGGGGGGGLGGWLGEVLGLVFLVDAVVHLGELLVLNGGWKEGELTRKAFRYNLRLSPSLPAVSLSTAFS